MNLDSEEEGALYVGCSGGRDTMGAWKLALGSRAKGSVVAMLKVTGLRGGHSGLEIDKGRGNAIKIINRVLLGLAETRRPDVLHSREATNITRSRAKLRRCSLSRRRNGTRL